MLFNHLLRFPGYKGPYIKYVGREGGGGGGGGGFGGGGESFCGGHEIF